MNYDTDFPAWAGEQAALLRRRAHNEIDWDNIAEEIEDLGNEKINACKSLLVRTMSHRLKMMAWPQSRDVVHWQAEANEFLAQARDRYAPSMRQKLDLAGLYQRAIRATPVALDDVPLTAPIVCPWTLDELLLAEDDR